MRRKFAESYYARNREKVLARSAAHRAAHREEIKATARAHYAAHAEEYAEKRKLSVEKQNARQAAWRASHRDYIKATYRAKHPPRYTKEERAERKLLKDGPEFQSVYNHWRWISGKTTSLKHQSVYIGMPFYRDWNPDHGGTILAGAKWIVENIGQRPQGTSLHVDHRTGLGFWPGNLSWQSPLVQSEEQRHKIVPKLERRIRELEQELAAAKLIISQIHST